MNRIDDLRQFEFYSKNHRDPYIGQLIDFKISEIDGHIHFDGYYYVLNEEFPKRIFFVTTVREDKPYKIEDKCNIYNIIEYKMYEVEIYDRVKFENTSSYDEVDEDGLKMRICYFPTCEQKILFKVIQLFDNFEDFLKRTSEYFKQEDIKDY